MKAVGTKLALASKSASVAQRAILKQDGTEHILVVTGLVSDVVTVTNGDWEVTGQHFVGGKWRNSKGRLVASDHAQFEDGKDNDYNDLEVIFVDSFADLPDGHPAKEPNRRD